MITFVGRCLFWLLCAMTAPTPPVPDLPPVLPPDAPRLDPLTPAEAAEHLPDDVEQWSVWEENAMRMFWGEQAVRATARPCWACGNPAGFHTEHLPCCKVPPFKLTSPMLPDGSTYRRTT